MHRRRDRTDEHEPGDVAALPPGAAAPGPGRTLCICVDDFGLHAGVNEAVARLADARRVHATGVMVGAPAFAAGLPLLRRLATQGVDIGLHLDFTAHPLHAGSRRGLGALVAASLLHRLPVPTLRAEIAAQRDAFEQALGRAPDFVDGHQHVHQLPQVREALLAELQVRAAPRPWLRCTRPPAGAPFKARLIAALGGSRFDALARAAGHGQNVQLLGVYDFRGGAAHYRHLLEGWLHTAQPGDLLMCHAATHAPADDAIGPARVAEYAVLSDPGFAGLLQRERLTLGPLRAQPAPAQG